MSDTIKSAIITGAAAILAAIIGVLLGKNIEQNSIQNQFNEAEGNFVNIVGDNNNVSINNVSELFEAYYDALQENESLRAQNMKYFDDLTKANNELEVYKNQGNQEVQQLQEQINDMPDIQYKDMSLSIDGNYIPINKSNSSVVVDNRVYYSDEFVSSLIDSNSNVSVQDNTMYIGKIVKEKSSLSDEWMVNSSYVKIEDNIVDSYGNTHTNALAFWDSKCSIIYNLNNKYSLLKCNISMNKDNDIDKSGSIIIKADDKVVYTSPSLTKTTKPYEIIDIPINNCSLLTIEYTTDSWNNDCIVSDVVVYN